MKLRKLFKEAIQPPAAGAGAAGATVSPGANLPPTFAVQAATQPEVEQPNPIGAHRLPPASELTKLMDATPQVIYNIEEIRSKAKADEKQADVYFKEAEVKGDRSLYQKALDLAKEAFNALYRIIDQHVLSGLRTKSFEVAKQRASAREAKGQFSGYFVAAGDIDHFRWLNKKLGHSGANAVLNYVGKVMSQHVEYNKKFNPDPDPTHPDSKPRAKVFHPHGDELGVMVYALGAEGEPLNKEQCQAILTELIVSVKKATVDLASKKWPVKGKDGKPGMPVQVTMSWAISTTYELADDMLMLTKSKDETTRFLLTVDSSLVAFYELGNIKGLLDPLGNMSVSQGETELRPILPGQMPTQVPVGPVDPNQEGAPTPQVPAPQAPQMAAQPQAPQQPQQPRLPVQPNVTPPMEHRVRRSRVMAEEQAQKQAKVSQEDAIAFVKDTQGMAFLQCDPRHLEEKDRAAIEKTREKQTGYLRKPKYYDPTTGLPLDEPYSPYPSDEDNGGQTG